MHWCASCRAQTQGVAWETALFANKEPNAFALPGGKVGVNTGIFTVAKNQDQLAAVLAHEIGHVVERHHDERITRQMGASGAVQLLGALAARDYGRRRSPPRVAACWRRRGFLLPGSRIQETEADVVGQRLMAEAGFDPAQAVESVAEHDRRRRWPPAAMAVHPPRPAIAHPGAAQSRRHACTPAYQQARAAGPDCRSAAEAQVCCFAAPQPCFRALPFLLALPPPHWGAASTSSVSEVPSR